MLEILIIVGLIGVICTLGLAYARQKNRVQTRLAVIVLATPLAIGIGYASGPIALGMAQTGAVSGYHQSLNGTVVNTSVTPYVCTRDGDCAHTYDCDSYQVLVSAAYTDTNHVYHPAVYRTDYHQCPVATMEYTYTITAVAWHTYTWNIVDHGFAANPKPWCCAEENDGDSSIPSDVPRGVPAQWLKARHDLAAGNSDPVTVDDTYENYILANEATILRANSDDINMLRKKHLMPSPPTAPVYDTYLSSKVSFVGLNYPASVQQAWQSAVMHLNAPLGTNLEGDLHVVAVNADELQGVVSPDAYAAAIQADRLNDYAKDAEAKNAIVLVVGVNPVTNTIAWARANTGMPIGNEAMFAALQNQLQGVAFDPNTVIGTATAKVTTVQTKSGIGYHVSYTLGHGIVEQVVMRTFPFQRACMNCTSARDKKVDAGQQGYVYLKTELPLPTWGVIVTIIVDILILAIVWGFALWLDYYFSSTTTKNRQFSTYGGY